MSDRQNTRTPYRLPEAAERLGVSITIVRHAVRSGELSAFKLGKCWYVRPESVDALLRGESADPAA